MEKQHDKAELDLKKLDKNFAPILISEDTSPILKQRRDIVNNNVN